MPSWVVTCPSSPSPTAGLAAFLPRAGSLVSSPAAGAPGWPESHLHDPFFDGFKTLHSAVDFSYYFRLLLNSVAIMAAETLALLAALLLGGLVRSG